MAITPHTIGVTRRNPAFGTRRHLTGVLGLLLITLKVPSAIGHGAAVCRGGLLCSTTTSATSMLGGSISWRPSKEIAKGGATTKQSGGSSCSAATTATAVGGGGYKGNNHDRDLCAIQKRSNCGVCKR
ncbi:hypothetical protein CCACVL1_26757 [Corchorus capsularis]|uniref:Uncharacterized protein n=1 Tax=Corchorus capsularis TaxID=210143 RepID=A0A1R3GDJ2_COCAP|nr:hypothetical protein CCACVL1_26757 [Corchorus capsularis]